MSNGPFHKGSTFHKDGALKQVKFGEGLPVLEVELNELQEIQNDRQQRLVRTLFSDGFITEPTILYRNGALEVSNADVVLGGEIIHISLLTIPLSNGEKVFLKAWEEEITYKDTIRKYGNQQEQAIRNKILDDRINRETTRRVQLKYDLVKEVKDGDTYIELGTLNGTNFVPSYPKSQLQAQGSLNDEEKTLIQNHLNNQTIHITQQERNAWNAKETPEGAQAKVDEHAKRTDNPHGVTKAQVGLGSVANYGVASQAEAEAGTANNKYMTPLRTKQAIDVIAMGLLRDVGLSGPAKDISNSDLNTINKTGFYQGNPLDNAPEGGNFRWYVIHIEATSQYALQIVSRVSALNMYYRIRTQSSTWSAWEKIETESGAQAKANTVQSNLNSHINNKNNPHGVTKAQVGLGNVANYGIATQSEAEGGSVNDKYMTPLRTKQAIDKHATSNAPHTYGGKFRWEYNPSTGTLDLVVL